MVQIFMQEKISVSLQHILPQHVLSRILGWFCDSRWIALKNWMIKRFIKTYDVNMSEAIIENPENFPCFNDFFTRHLKPELRPIVQEQNQIACPVDGTVSQIGVIKKDLLFQAKNFYFNVTDLLGGSESRAQSFLDGNFATFYLAPRDYHRVHMPISGQLQEAIYIPGKLFSVNQKTTQYVPNLFARNERLVCIFKTEIGPMAIILVGAMLVASINTVWKKDEKNINLLRGEELGYFKLGSTVIVLFGKNQMSWTDNLKETSIVKMGQLIGTHK